MLNEVKDKLKLIHAFRGLWGTYRDRSFLREYRSRRDSYSRQAHERKLVYSGESTRDAVRERMKQRGYSPLQRKIGDVHTFAFVPRISWHAVLFNDLRELGPVSEYDYVKDEYRWEEFARRDNNSVRRRRAMSARVLPALREAHKRRPVDWVYFYASGLEIPPDLIRTIHDEMGIPTVCMCLDDKNSWCGPEIDNNRSGQIDLAPIFDLSWTSARVACEWYLCEGGRPIYMPEGFDMQTFYSSASKPEYDVSFVGASYGFRPLVIEFLKKHGVSVATFGNGWDAGPVSSADTVRIFSSSKINLGMGGIGYSEELTNVKGRDFDIPGTGGGVYLTSFNSDLAQHFEVGREILCYSNRDELLELIHFYLSHPDEAAEIAARGRARCIHEHRWLHRYQRICRIFGILHEL